METSATIAALRQEYQRATLDEAAVSADPLIQFRAWFDDAVRAKLPMVNAMTLATVSATSRPSARIVLLKGVDNGFVFYTNYASRKGQELGATPYAALVVYWIELEREVRIEGRVEKTSAQESTEYFDSRPLGSRLAAIASPQSEEVRDRAALETRYADAERTHGAQPARPAHWGGYRLFPELIEFWQGRPNRLHDRLLYRRASSAWRVSRLAP
jgi:pyridoxamine 5'-phosphate oxidase